MTGIGRTCLEAPDFEKRLVDQPPCSRICRAFDFGREVGLGAQWAAEWLLRGSWEAPGLAHERDGSSTLAWTVAVWEVLGSSMI